MTDIVQTVGFTGSRAGMTAKQKETVAQALRFYVPLSDHHGDCVGADTDFHEICKAQHLAVFLHPPSDPKHRAFNKGLGVVARPARPYLQRNGDIVVACDLLIACPKEDAEPAAARGQGTWSTVRYARKHYKATMIVWPNGKAELT